MHVTRAKCVHDGDRPLGLLQCHCQESGLERENANPLFHRESWHVGRLLAKRRRSLPRSSILYS